MLYVKTPDEALQLIRETFQCHCAGESVQLGEACGRTLYEDIRSAENVPDFNRSTVDGYAVCARDTFGASESIPSILPLAGEIKMGESAGKPIEKGTCVAVPTGGDIPEGADAVVMVERTEDYGDGTIGIIKPVAPGDNLIFRGDDVTLGEKLLPAGHILATHDIGALAALGIGTVNACEKPLFGIISTGDELVEFTEKPRKGQIRNVNSILLETVVRQSGGLTRSYGIIRDNVEALSQTVETAISECQAVLISGGSSVGMKDATARVIEKKGSILFHGIAMKPGKPTILGSIGGKPVFGLPGHPVAAYFVAQLFIVPLIGFMMGCRKKNFGIPAKLGEAISSNHGREEYIGVILNKTGDTLTALPIHGKSGLISILAGSDGYICIPRDCEGLPKAADVSVTLWNS